MEGTGFIKAIHHSVDTIYGTDILSLVKIPLSRKLYEDVIVLKQIKCVALYVIVAFSLPSTTVASDKVQGIVDAWTAYLKTIPNWENLIKHPEEVKHNGCGTVYELANPIERPNEGFAVVDMRNVKINHPHYHINEIEIYIVLSGKAIVVVGGKEQLVEKGSVVVTLPNTAHFIVPQHDFVIAIVNTPPFNVADEVTLEKSDPSVGFDQMQYQAFVNKL